MSGSGGSHEFPGRPAESRDALRRRIAAHAQARFGLLPNVFRLPPENPEITVGLLEFGALAYLDNPLPSLFKERLFVYLSRFCAVRYCIVRHVGFLVGLGCPSGDPRSPVQSVEEVLRLVTRPLPNADELSPFVARLRGLREPLADMPPADDELEQALLACAAHVFLQTPDARQCHGALRYALGESSFQYLLVFLAFIRMAHYWIQVHPELDLEEDLKQLLRSQQKLAEVLLDDQEAVRSRVGQALLDELACLRRETQRRGELLRAQETRAKSQEHRLDRQRVRITEQLAELGRLNVEVADTRHTVAELREEALTAREALRMSEGVRGQKEAFQAVINGASLAESLAPLVRMITGQTQGAARTAFYAADANGHCLHPVWGVGDMPESYLRQVDGTPVSEDSFACGLALSTGVPVLTADIFEEPLWQSRTHLGRDHDFRACWSFPIKTRLDKPVGTLALYFREPRKASAKHIALAATVTQAAAVIMSHHAEAQERARAEHALRESEAHRNTLRRQLAQAEEEERRRIARELHDQIGQDMTALSLHLALLRNDPRSAGIRDELAAMQQLVSDADRELDGVVSALRPTILDDLGLSHALYELTQAWAHALEVPVGLDTDGFDGNRLPHDVETIIYRVAQESLNNVGKHARATAVSVSLSCCGGGVALTVQDNGRGFDTSRPSAGTFGLAGMRERASLIGGSLAIESAARSGTTVRLRVPGPPARDAQ
jgi:signal transduction histidine kinase